MKDDGDTWTYVLLASHSDGCQMAYEDFHGVLRIKLSFSKEGKV